MKKYIALFVLLAAPAIAAVDCQQLPDCEAYGYTCSADDCSGLKTLSCPFDESKKICWPEAKECEVGSLLFDDFKCYDVACGRTPIAVVFDTENRLARQLHFGKDHVSHKNVTNHIYGVDIPELENCATAAEAETTCGTDGKTNTKIIIDYITANNLSFIPAEHCYYSTFGGLPEGSWWLPSVKELKIFHQNKNDVIPTLARYNVTLTNYYYWSSTELNLERFYAIDNGGRTITDGHKLNSAHHIDCIIGY